MSDLIAFLTDRQVGGVESGVGLKRWGSKLGSGGLGWGGVEWGGLTREQFMSDLIAFLTDWQVGGAGLGVERVAGRCVGGRCDLGNGGLWWCVCMWGWMGMRAACCSCMPEPAVLTITWVPFQCH